MVSKFQEASLKKKGEERTQAQEKCLLFSLFFFLATPFSMWDFNSPAAAAAAKSLQSCPTLSHLATLKIEAVFPPCPLDTKMKQSLQASFPHPLANSTE